MLEQGEKVIGGCRILMKALGLQSGWIGVEANKLDAVDHLKALVGAKDDIKVEAAEDTLSAGRRKTAHPAHHRAGGAPGRTACPCGLRRLQRRDCRRRV